MTTTTSPGTDNSTSTATNGSVRVALKLTTLRPQTVAVGAPAASNAAVATAQRLVDRYLAMASRDALLNGKIDPRYRGLFSPAAAASLRGEATQVIADIGLGRARKSTTVEGTVTFTSLVGADRRIAAVDATIQTATVADTAAGRFAIARGGELLVMPVGATWRIVGYDLTLARRDLATGVTTTTTASGGSKP